MGGRPIPRCTSCGYKFHNPPAFDCKKPGWHSKDGTATVSEVLPVLEVGVTEMKFFPAEASGGTAYLSSLASPLAAARFCPTGGITARTAPDYLALPNVGCVGGSWLTPRDALVAGDWARVEALAREAAALA